MPEPVETALRNALALRADGHYLGALRNLDMAAAAFTELVADVAQEAYDDGATKKAVAEALGVSPNMLRGMQRTSHASV